ncbi:MAG: hypothetical protein E3J83_03295 [Candidatus Atribacteria bacterium]|nr:MAG: hypothetical protein E3J83_03295 [Candidatus Atribacteria bacterium]
MGEIVISEAQKTHNIIVAIKSNIHKDFMSLAVCLKAVKTNAYYLELDFSSFEEYCAQPDVDLTVNRCNKLIRIYDRWIEDFGYTVEEIAGTDTECLDIAQSQASEENKEEWLERAKLLSRADLRALTPGSQHRAPMVICPYCEHIFDVSRNIFKGGGRK